MKKLITRIAKAIAKNPKIKQFVVILTKRVGLHSWLKALLLPTPVFESQVVNHQSVLPRSFEDNECLSTARSRRVYADLLGELERIRSESA